MAFLMVLRVAFKALARNKMRTALTMLGMIIGVAAVIAMVTVGEGSAARIQSDIAKLGSNMLIVCVCYTEVTLAHTGLTMAG